MVLREKGVEFEAHEVDLQNKSEEFLEASPTGKVPVILSTTTPSTSPTS